MPSVDNFRKIGVCRITRKRSKKGFEYPMVRFPKEYEEMIGKYAEIYRVGETSYLLVITDEFHNSEKPEGQKDNHKPRENP